MKKRDLAESAETETLAQLEIIRALKPLEPQGRQSVMFAVGHLLMAEQAVPGVLDAFLKGRSK